MGLMERILGWVFGGGGRELRQTVEVFRENAEARAARNVELQEHAVSHFAAEFARADKGAFDKFMDGVNRVPRPALALGTLALFVAAMLDPLWFAARMQGIALVPEPLWWLLGVIVSFYFGARHQLKNQDFQRDIARSLQNLPQAESAIRHINSRRDARPGVADSGAHADLTVASIRPDENAALETWRRQRLDPRKTATM
ncbi:MAG: holin family protein [Arenibacterium sp.]